jgi:hypothetical protein
MRSIFYHFGRDCFLLGRPKSEFRFWREDTDGSAFVMCHFYAYHFGRQNMLSSNSFNADLDLDMQVYLARIVGVGHAVKRARQTTKHPVDLPFFSVLAAGHVRDDSQDNTSRHMRRFCRFVRALFATLRARKKPFSSLNLPARRLTVDDDPSSTQFV